MLGKIPLTACDCFINALEKKMRLSGQGRYFCLSVLELDQKPNLATLKKALTELSLNSPILRCQIRRHRFLPHWLAKLAKKDSDNASVQLAKKKEVNFEQFCQDLLNDKKVDNLRFYFCQDKKSYFLVMRWRHRLLDARGAELLLKSLIQNLHKSDCLPQKLPIEHYLPIFKKRKTFVEKIKAYRAATEIFFELKKKTLFCLDKTWREKRNFFRRITFNKKESSQIKQNLLSSPCALTPNIYFAAAAARVVNQLASQTQDDFLIILPMQKRLPAATQPIWQNHLSMIFLYLANNDLRDKESCRLRLLETYKENLRAKREQNFACMFEIMRILPSRVYVPLICSQMNGCLSSFSYSYTGECLDGEDEFFGAKIIDAFHIPSVPSPPGLGVFFSEKNAKLTCIFSYRAEEIDMACEEKFTQLIKAEILEA